MSEYPKFTPGPWTVKEDGARGESCIWTSDAERLNGGCMIGRAYGPDRAANAPLLAAAPIFYEACGDMEGDDRLGWLDCLINLFRERTGMAYASVFDVPDPDAEMMMLTAVETLRDDLRAAIAAAKGRS